MSSPRERTQRKQVKTLNVNFQEVNLINLMLLQKRIKANGFNRCGDFMTGVEWRQRTNSRGNVARKK